MFYRFRLLAGFIVSLVVLYANGLSANTINVPADHAPTVFKSMGKIYLHGLPRATQVASGA